LQQFTTLGHSFFTRPCNDEHQGRRIVNEALLLSILSQAAHGGECYRTKDRRVTTLREFQLLVETAQHAVRDGLIEASFQAPSKGKLSAGLIRTFTVLSITPAGTERLAELGARRLPASSGVPVTNAATPARPASR
jgi:hypothetical protein